MMLTETAATMTTIPHPAAPPLVWTEPAPGARLACAEWLVASGALEHASIDLVYIDPPFNTGRTRADRAGAFDDAWPTMADYIDWLGARLESTAPLLRPSGSILLHLDPRASHRARVLLDDVFGADRFVNHLIWSYGLGGSSARRFARKHDDILFYCVNPDQYWFEAPRVPATSRRLAGQSKKATDVLDIPAINNMAKERVGWPTQKPLALLDLLIRACCPPGGVVFDPCCGSGTTLVAAVGAGRSAIGSDHSEKALHLAASRLFSLTLREK